MIVEKSNILRGKDFYGGFIDSVIINGRIKY